MKNKLIICIIIFSIAATMFLSGCVDNIGPCEEAEDCEGLPHIECYGEWTCTEGECNYVCAMEPEDE